MTTSAITRPILVLGIGNLLMGDEGVGVHVARRLSRVRLGPHVQVVDGGTGGFALLGPMQEARRIVLVDAAVIDAAPGTVRVLTPKYSTDYPRTLTAHDVGFKDLLDAFDLLGHSCDVTLFAIAIDPQQSLSTELSPEVAAAADRVVDLVLADVTSAHDSDPLRR